LTVTIEAAYDLFGISPVNLQELRYFVAIADHEHFGRAAKACFVSQPTLSGQLRKLEEHLGVTLFERTNKRVALTPIGEKLLVHARQALQEAHMIEATATAARNPLLGPARLGVIPTVAPYLMPLILGPFREAYPAMTIELWEDLTNSLLTLLRSQQLDAALIATEVTGHDLTVVPLFVEPFLAALPVTHRLAAKKKVNVKDLADDLLVLADGHCLADQALALCGRDAATRRPFQAASLDTLVNLVAAGYGTTLIPGLAAGLFSGRNVVLRPLTGKISRTIRLASRRSFPRPQVLRALEKVIRRAMATFE
jgi:LysR family hydrogen peroxide-inducible transcriptional activator